MSTVDDVGLPLLIPRNRYRLNWLADRPFLTDLGLAALLALAAVFVTFSADGAFGDSAGPVTPVGWIISFGSIYAVPFRRIAPRVAVVVGGLLQTLPWANGFADLFLATSILLYSATVHGGPTGRRLSWAVGAALTLYTTLGVVTGNAPVFAVPIVALYAVAAVAFGIASTNRGRYVEAVEARADAAERSMVADRDRALTEERNRIARELHDVVAHGLSVVVVQAAAAQRILDRDPDGARSALNQIEQTSRKALGEMRHVLSAIRTDPDESWKPAPGLSDLDELVDELRQIGLRVSVTTSGLPDPSEGEVPSTVDLTAYRIVQESLTNVLKHGGSGATATVDIAQGERTLDLAIVDDGRGAAAEPGGGHGLRGMRERVEVFGGEFRAGPERGGGFAVRVSLPIDGDPARSRPEGARP